MWQPRASGSPSGSLYTSPGEPPPRSLRVSPAESCEPSLPTPSPSTPNPSKPSGIHRNVQSHCDLGTGDGLESFGAGCLGEFHGPVQAVVIRERHGRIAQLEGPKNQLLRMRGSIQEGEAGVAVELDIGRRGHDIRFLFGLERIIDRKSVGCNERAAAPTGCCSTRDGAGCSPRRVP